MLMNQERIITSSQLSRATNHTFAGINIVVNRLIEKGLLERKIDGRSKFLWLTEKGRRAADLINKLKQELTYG